MTDASFLTDLGRRVADRRKELGLTQEALAERVELSLQSVSCIELGKKAIRPDNLVRFCNVLDVSADYLLMGKRDDRQVSELYKMLGSLCERDYGLVEALVKRFFIAE